MGITSFSFLDKSTTFFSNCQVKSYLSGKIFYSNNTYRNIIFFQSVSSVFLNILAKTTINKLMNIYEFKWRKLNKINSRLNQIFKTSPIPFCHKRLKNKTNPQITLNYRGLLWMLSNRHEIKKIPTDDRLSPIRPLPQQPEQSWGIYTGRACLQS